MAEFRKCKRDAKLLLSPELKEWRLASVDEVLKKENLAKINKNGILNSWDTARLLNGCVREKYSAVKQYRPNLEEMLLIKTEESRPKDGSFPEKMYSGDSGGKEISGVKWTTKRGIAAILLSAEDKITEAICFVLYGIVQKKADDGQRAEELNKLTKCLQEKFGNGRTVLHYAVNQPYNKKYGEYVAKKLKDGFKGDKSLIKAADRFGRTALHFAAFHGNTEVCRIIIEDCEIEADGTDINKENVLHFAVKGKQKGVLDYLLPKVQSIIALLEAARGGHVGAVELLLNRGSRPLHERNSDGRTALHYAVQLSNQNDAVKMAKSLLKSCESDEEKSLLLWAGSGTAEEASPKSSQVEKYLEAERAQNPPTLEKLFMFAIKLKHNKIAWELIKSGANIADIKKIEPCYTENKQAVDNVLNNLRNINNMAGRSGDQPAIFDSLGRNEFAEGLAALFLNPYSSLMIQTEIILLRTAAQLAFPNSLGTEKFPECKQIEQSKKVLQAYEKINKAVKDLLPSSATPTEVDPLVQFLDGDYEQKYHKVYKSLALRNRYEIFPSKHGENAADSSSMQHSLRKIPSVLTIRYNAWHYQNEREAWAGLAVEVTKAIEESMTRAQRDTSIPRSSPPHKEYIRMIVFIDDLDRCQDKVILQVLSAINLVLAACSINVVLGIDMNMLERVMKGEFPHNDNAKELADKYIGKMVQLQLALLDPNEDESKHFLEIQLGPEFEEGFAPDDAESEAPMEQSSCHEQSSADNNQDCVYLKIEEASQSCLSKQYPVFESSQTAKGKTAKYVIQYADDHANLQHGRANSTGFFEKTNHRGLKASARMETISHLPSYRVAHSLPEEGSAKFTRMAATTGYMAILLLAMERPTRCYNQEGENEDDEEEDMEEGEVDTEQNPKPEEERKTPDLKNEESDEKLEQLKEEWISLKDAFTIYDVSIECLGYFQKFRLHCEVGDLAISVPSKTSKKQSNNRLGEDQSL
ncbi:hypothetical protein SUGI_0704230 [Cryptomeria japonica]|nr:hypothetical protein SUGI_0704230 [Cryptomeria japonica]